MIDDKRCLLSVSEWPNSEFGHYCCLKKSNGNRYDHAFILEADNPNGMEGKIVVSLGAIFDGGTGETVTFDSIDHLLQEGWLID